MPEECNKRLRKKVGVVKKKPEDDERKQCRRKQRKKFGVDKKNGETRRKLRKREKNTRDERTVGRTLER